MEKRQCGTCTKCCEGWLTGQALGYNFYVGNPCHFISIGKGCTVYAKRPKDPCVQYKCAWLSDEAIPEWMKPDQINAIIDNTFVKGIPYMRVIEAGEKLDSRVLTWLIQYALKNKLNFYWEVLTNKNWLGSQEFLNAMENPNSVLPKDKSLHLISNQDTVAEE